MPTAKDLEVAGKLIRAQVLSKLEMQKYLDEIDSMRKRGEKTALEDFLVSRKIVSSEQITSLKPPAKRLVACSGCQATYNVRSEDIGTSFKCRKCGAMVEVPQDATASVPSFDLSSPKPDPLNLGECTLYEISPVKVKKTEEREAEEKADSTLFVDGLFAASPVKMDIPSLSFDLSGGQEPLSQAVEMARQSQENLQSCFQGYESWRKIYTVECMLAVHQESPLDENMSWWVREKDEEFDSEETSIKQTTAEQDGKYLTLEEEKAFAEWAEKESKVDLEKNEEKSL